MKRIAVLEPCNISRLGYRKICEEYNNVSIKVMAKSIGEFKSMLHYNEFDVAVIDPINLTTGLYDEGVFHFLEYYCCFFEDKPLIIFSSDRFFPILYSNLYEHLWLILDKKTSIDNLYDFILGVRKNKESCLRKKIHLSSKERYVLLKIMQGNTLTDIAKDLNCSFKTVSGHKVSAIKKFLFANKVKYKAPHPAILRKIPKCMYSYDIDR